MEIRNQIYSFHVDSKVTGKRIKELRKNKGLTAEGLAEKLYLSAKTISSWETGARFPLIDHLVDLANLFEVSVHSLMLPKDNCCVEFENFLTSSWTSLDKSEEFNFFTDEFMSQLFVREEYLMQRYLSGVFTRKNEYEYRVCIANPLSLNLLSCNLFSEATSRNNAEGYFDLLKSQEGRKELFHKLFRRLHNGEKLSHTIKALNRFDMDVLFTACVYFEELRNKEFVQQLYDSGARFFYCDFLEKASEIDTTIRDRLNEKRISHILTFEPSDIPFEEELPEKVRAAIDKITEVTMGVRAPEGKTGVYWAPKVVEKEHREVLAGYFFLLDYVRDHIQTFGEYQKLVVESENMQYDEYLSKVLKEGYLAK